MRDLTSTKREFTALGRRLYRRRPLSANRAFRGVIGRGFGIWIREHWGLSNAGFVRPADREFQTKKKPFALLSWPQAKRAGETRYTFSPTIHLTCFPQQTNNSLFEFDARGGFLERIFQIFSRESSTHSQNTKLKEFLSSLFSTLSRTVGEVTRSRDSERSLRSGVRRFEEATPFRRDFALVRSSPATTEVRNHFIALPPLILSGSPTGEDKTVSTEPLSTLSTSSHWQRTINLHPRLDHRFPAVCDLSAKNAPVDGRSHFGTNVFTTLALNFAAPKVSEMDLVAKRISQFVSSPELTHIKRQQAVSEEMLNALRGLRTPNVESKPAPAPVMPSIEQLTNQVRDQLERELRIERERRGL